MIQESELIINRDGSVFHLHLKPEELAQTVILVGDPKRSDMIAERFDNVRVSRSNREFVSYTGSFQGKDLTVISTGIGCDNIDIVINELDALVNVDFSTREVKPRLTSLEIVRLGTSGALDPTVEIGDYISSEFSIGIDGLLNFYGDSQRVRDRVMELSFIEQTSWSESLARPYIIHNDTALLEKFDTLAKRGTTISAPGFYAPQGRVVRLPLFRDDYLSSIETFRYDGRGVTNFEMEGSAIAGLGSMLGHRTLTVCAIIAQRNVLKSQPNYQTIVDRLIDEALDRLSTR